jgi:hypothetical protein
VFGWFSKYSAEHYKVDLADEIQTRDKDRFSGVKLVDYKVVAKTRARAGQRRRGCVAKEASRPPPPSRASCSAKKPLAGASNGSYAKAFPTKLVASQWAMGIRFLEGKVPGDSRWSYELPLPADFIPKIAGGG